MARQIEGVYEKVLECAKAEFLEKGFKDASLRIIAQKADTSTSSIYTRFSDKEGLYKALVSPVVNDLREWFVDAQEGFHQLPGEKQKQSTFEYSAGKIESFIDCIYDNYDIFKILIVGSEGTEFSNYINDFVELDVAYTTKFLELTQNDAITSGRASPQLLHMLTSAYYLGIFETVIHDMTRKEAHIYVRQLRRFFMCGWKDIFSPQDE